VPGRSFQEASLYGVENLLCGDGDGQQMAVIDRVAVHLLREHAEHVDPGELAGEGQGDKG
jgi:hypothetical protein